MDRGKIKQRLLKLPPAASAAFAGRAAMRWMPFLAVVPKSGILARIGLVRQQPFSYWKEAKRQVWLLMLFRSQIGAVCVACNNEASKHFVRENWRTAVAAAAAAANAADEEAYAAAAADAAAAHAAAYAVTNRLQSFFLMT